MERVSTDDLVPSLTHSIQLVLVNPAFRSHLYDTWQSCRRELHRFKSDPAQAIVSLQTFKRIPARPDSVAQFLFCSHGEDWLPPRAVGQFITAPLLYAPGAPDVGLAREDVLDEFVKAFDFSFDSPPQALRRLLSRTQMPQRSKG